MSVAKANIEVEEASKRELSKGDEGARDGETYQVVQQLLADNLHHLEGGFGGHGVDKHIAVDANEVLAVHDTVLILYTSVSSVN